MNLWNRQSASHETSPVTIVGQSIVLLHKILKEEDQLRAMRKQGSYGISVKFEPTIAIDFAYVTSVQEDYKNNGTVVIDKKTAVVVKESFADVLEAWVKIQNDMQKSM